MAKAVKSGRGSGILKKDISFKGCTTSIEEIMGKKPVAAADMVKAIWAYVKEHGLKQVKA
jgi:chromatin remodeling complex protein RSC6